METMDKMDWFSPVLFVHTMDAISPMDILDNPGPDKKSIACTFFYFPQYKQKGRGVPGISQHAWFCGKELIRTVRNH